MVAADEADQSIHALAAASVAVCVFMVLIQRRMTASKQARAPEGEFDYIIVGGGLAGCVLAARLSEDPAKRVLVIEPGSASPDNIFIRISGAILKLFRNRKFDWCWQTVEELGCLGRRIFLCRGKLLGGSTCLNAELVFRGSPADYDWGRGWSAADAAETFDRVELRSGEPLRRCGVNMQEPDYQHELSRRFLETCEAEGESLHPDMIRRRNFNDWAAVDPTEASSNRGFGRFELSQVRLRLSVPPPPVTTSCCLTRIVPPTGARHAVDSGQ